jgi:hypothetical protein
VNNLIYIQQKPDLDLGYLREKSQAPTLGDYPTIQDRLSFSLDEWQEAAAKNCIELPGGPWHVDLPGRNSPETLESAGRLVTPQNPANPERVKAWKALGLLTTTLGLPLHPLAEVGFTTIFDDGSELGMFTGPGMLGEYGPHVVASLGLRRVRQEQAEYLSVAVECSGKTKWWLPVGHAEPGQSAYETALKGAGRQVGVRPELVAGLIGRMVRTAPSLFGPNTAVAWLDENFLMFDGGDSPSFLDFQPELQDGGEVIEARWISLGEIATRPDFSSAHLSEIRAFEASRY